MNKYVIIFLIICVVSVQVNAFVRREAETPVKPPTTDAIAELFNQAKAGLENLGKQVQDNLTAEKFKEGLDMISKTFDEVKAKISSGNGTTDKPA